jgi:hypothetical protein
MTRFTGFSGLTAWVPKKANWTSLSPFPETSYSRSLLGNKSNQSRKQPQVNP